MLNYTFRWFLWKKIKGFKAFNKGLITRQGQKLELEKMYELKEQPVFMSVGYYMCKNLEDTLRYFDCDSIEICAVEGYPDYVKYYDDYAGSDEMYICQKILLTHLLTPQEIIEEAKKMTNFRFRKFAAYYPLTEEEKIYFLQKYIDDYWILSDLIYSFFDKEIYKKINSKTSLKEIAKQYIKK